MSDTPPKVKEVFITLGTSAFLLAIYGLFIKGGIAQINVVEWLCLACIGIPIFIIFALYKILEKYRANNPAKESVQKLRLDE